MSFLFSIIQKENQERRGGFRRIFMKELLKNKELCKKILILIGVMTLIRIGSQIPIPGVNTEYMRSLIEDNGLTFFNMITGHSFSQMSFFALSISPYITASIMFQLLGIVIPAIEEWKKDGKTGQEKLERGTIIMALIIAFLQSLFMSIGLGSRGLLSPYSWWMVLITTVIWTSGAGALIFIGNRLTKLKLGSGISYILLCNILSSFPQDLQSLYEVFLNGREVPFQIVNGLFIFFVFAAIILVAVVLQLSYKRIPTVFSGKLTGGYTPKHEIPIPLNACGVMPIIFSGTIFSMPLLVASFFPNIEWLSYISMYLNERNWFVADSWKYTVGAIIYILLTLIFAKFYLNITFNSIEMANNLRQQGATIPGIRPGKPTQDYLDGIISRIGMFGAVLVLVLILSMTFLCNSFGIGSLSIGGTSILICVSVIIEASKAIKSEMSSANARNYSGLTGRKEILSC